MNSREKGARFERRVAKMLRDAGFPAVRSARNGVAGAEDLITGIDGWWIECKHRSDISVGSAALVAACEQAARDCPAGSRWVVIWRQTGARQVLATYQADCGCTFTCAIADWIFHAAHGEKL